MSLDANIQSRKLLAVSWHQFNLLTRQFQTPQHIHFPSQIARCPSRRKPRLDLTGAVNLAQSGELCLCLQVSTQAVPTVGGSFHSETRKAPRKLSGQGQGISSFSLWCTKSCAAMCLSGPPLFEALYPLFLFASQQQKPLHWVPPHPPPTPPPTHPHTPLPISLLWGSQKMDPWQMDPSRFSFWTSPGSASESEGTGHPDIRMWTSTSVGYISLPTGDCVTHL